MTIAVGRSSTRTWRATSATARCCRASRLGVDGRGPVGGARRATATARGLRGAIVTTRSSRRSCWRRPNRDRRPADDRRLASRRCRSFATPRRALRRPTAPSSPSAPTTACTAVTGRSSATCSGWRETRGLRTAVVTFDRHPAAVVRPESAPPLLTDLDQKLELLAATGRRLRLRDPLRRGALEGAGRGVRHRGAGRLPRRQGRRGRRGLPLRSPAPGQRRAAARRWAATAGFDVVGIELVDVDGAPAADDEDARVSSTAIRVALRDGRPRSPPTRCSAGPTRCAVSWSTATSGPATSASRPPTWPCPTRSACRPTASTPAGTCDPTACRRPPPSRSVGGRPSTSTPTGRCSRRTSSTSTATSTASRPACGSSPGCATS